MPLATLRDRGYTSVHPFDPAEASPWEGDRAPQRRLAPWFPDLALRPCALLTLDGRRHLVYQAPGELILAGPPERSGQLSEEWELLSWRIPRSLAALYAVHHGIGPADGPRARWRRDALVPSESLVPLNHRMRFGEENILYPPADLLLFAVDGRGGGACFHRADPEEEDPPVRYWDAQTRALGPRTRLEAVCAALGARWSGAAAGREPGVLRVCGE